MTHAIVFGRDYIGRDDDPPFFVFDKNPVDLLRAKGFDVDDPLSLVLKDGQNENGKPLDVRVMKDEQFEELVEAGLACVRITYNGALRVHPLGRAMLVDDDFYNFLNMEFAGIATEVPLLGTGDGDLLKIRERNGHLEDEVVKLRAAVERLEAEKKVLTSDLKKSNGRLAQYEARLKKQDDAIKELKAAGKERDTTTAE